MQINQAVAARMERLCLKRFHFLMGGADGRLDLCNAALQRVHLAGGRRGLLAGVTECVGEGQVHVAVGQPGGIPVQFPLFARGCKGGKALRGGQ